LKPEDDCLNVKKPAVLDKKSREMTKKSSTALIVFTLLRDFPSASLFKIPVLFNSRIQTLKKEE